MKNKDDLEEQGLLELCTNCGSINLIEYNIDQKEDRVVCGDCGTVDFTHCVSEVEYIAGLKTEEGG